MSVLKRYTGTAWEVVGGAEAPPITIAYAQVTANQTGIAADTDLTGLSVTFTANSGRRYKITAHVLVQQLTSTGAATGKITDAANVEYQRYGHNAAFLANGVEVWHGSRVISGLSGSQTFKLRAGTSAGSLTALADPARPNFILVEDITGGSGSLSGSAVTPDTVPASPNAADYEFDATSSSLPSGWSWVNQSTSTYREELGAGVITLPGGGVESHRLIVRAIPAATTWTATFKMVGTFNLANYSHYGLYLRQSSDGKLYGLGQFSDVGVRLISWTNTAGGGTARVTFGGNAYRPTSYFRVRRNSATSWDFYASPDGVTWSTVATAHDVSAFMTPDQIGWGGNAQGSTTNIETSCHWFRVT